nr:hypothetical protein [Tanacetum cinerariifolium]
MSSASSAVTYTSVYTDFEPGRVFWGTDEELLDEEPSKAPILPAYASALPIIVLDVSPVQDTNAKPFEDPSSPDYALASDDDSKMLAALESPDYTPWSDKESEPSEIKPTKEDPPQTVTPPPAQITPTPSIEPAPVPLVIPRRRCRATTEHYFTPSYIFIFDTEADPSEAPILPAYALALPIIVLDVSPVQDTNSKPFEDPSSPDYALASDDDSKMLATLESPDYTPWSDKESEPSEIKPTEEDPPQTVTPPPTQITPTPSIEPAPVPLVIPRRRCRATT